MYKHYIYYTCVLPGVARPSFRRRRILLRCSARTAANDVRANRSKGFLNHLLP